MMTSTPRSFPALALVLGVALAGCSDEVVPAPSDAGPPPQACTTNAECNASQRGSICRKSDHTCVAVRTQQCPTILGREDALADDRVVILGALTPAGSGELGDVMQKAVELAVQEISPATTNTNIPVGDEKPPLVVLACQEWKYPFQESLTSAANHLVNDVQVPVVIGPYDGSNARIVASIAAQTGKAVTILPGAITSALDTLNAPGLPSSIWRLGHGESQQTALLQAFLTTQLVPKLRADGKLAENEDLRVAIVNEDDFEGKEMAGHLQRTLTWNTNANGTPSRCADNLAKALPSCFVADFTDLGSNETPDAAISRALTALLESSPPPHVVLHSYGMFGLERVLVPIEASWENAAPGSPRPYHVGLFPEMNANAPLLQLMARDDADATAPLRERVFAFAPHVDDTVALARQDFVLTLTQMFPELQGSSSAGFFDVRRYYDAVYLAAYAVTANGEAPLTGENLAAMLPRLVTGQRIGTGPIDRVKASTILASGGTIQLTGVSGPLDLDAATGAAKHDVELTCPNGTATAPSSFEASGYFTTDGTVSASKVFDLPTKCKYLRAQ